MNDLPPRTWRRWWLEWPKWFRIGCYGALGMVLLNISVGIRIAIGLMESPEISELNRRKVDFSFVWESGRPELFEGQQTLAAGLLGKSGSNVRRINFDDYATDADLQMIGRYFHNLEELDAPYTEISRDGIRSLRACKQLRILNLAANPLDDAAVAELVGLNHLTELDLSGTLITDSTLPSLRQLDSLKKLVLYDTDVTLAAIERLSINNPQLTIWENAGDRYDEVLCSIAWSNGARSVNVDRWARVSVLVDGPLPEEGDPFQFGEDYLTSRCYLLGQWRGENNWSTSELISRGDGDFRFQLRIGDYSSEPVIIRVNDGRPLSRSVEFHMPCTRAEAMDDVE